MHPDEIIRLRAQQRAAAEAEQEQRDRAEGQRQLAYLQTAPRELARRLVESGHDGWWSEVKIQLVKRGKVKSAETRAGVLLCRYTVETGLSAGRYELYLLADGRIVFARPWDPAVVRVTVGSDDHLFEPRLGAEGKLSYIQQMVYRNLVRLREALDAGKYPRDWSQVV